MKRIIDELLTYDHLLQPYPLYGMARKYFIFIFGGGIGLLLVLAVTSFLTEVMGIWYAVSYVFGLVAAIIFTFVYHSMVTFSLRSKWKRRFAKFAVTVLVISASNWVMVYTATEFLRIHYLASIFFVTLFLSLVNFGVNKLWIFRT